MSSSTTPTTPRRKSGYQALLFMLISVVIAALISFIVWRMLTVYNERPPTWQEQATAAGWVSTPPVETDGWNGTDPLVYKPGEENPWSYETGWCEKYHPCAEYPPPTECPECRRCKECPSAAAAGASAPAVVAPGMTTPVATPFDPAGIDYRPLPGFGPLVPRARKPPDDEGEDTGA